MFFGLLWHSKCDGATVHLEVIISAPSGVRKFVYRLEAHLLLRQSRSTVELASSVIAN